MLPIYMYTNRALRFLAGGLMLLSILVPVPAWGIGQITSPIVQEDLLQGQEFKVEIQPYNSEESVQIFDLSTNGAVAGWAKFYATDDLEFKTPITEVSVQPRAYARAMAVFVVPEGTPNGLYNGGVAVAARAPEKGVGEEGSNTSVVARVTRKVRITVTDQENIAFAVQVIPASFDVPNGGSLEVRFIYENTGNVNIRPDTRLKIIELESGRVVHEAIYIYPSDEEAVRVRTRKDMTYLEWPVGNQSSGRYRAEFSFEVAGQSYFEKEFKFTIGYLSIGGLLAMGASIGTGGGLMALGLALLVLSIILSSKKRRRKAFKVLTQAAARIKSLF